MRFAFSIALGVSIVLFTLLGYTTWLYADLSIRVEFARDQIDTCKTCKEEALTSPKEEAKKYLDYIIAYYSSGTKQIRDSTLDHVVEAYRDTTIAEIQRYLDEEETGQQE